MNHQIQAQIVRLNIFRPIAMFTIDVERVQDEQKGLVGWLQGRVEDVSDEEKVLGDGVDRLS